MPPIQPMSPVQPMPPIQPMSPVKHIPVLQDPAQHLVQYPLRRSTRIRNQSRRLDGNNALISGTSSALYPTLPPTTFPQATLQPAVPATNLIRVGTTGNPISTSAPVSSSS
ncbi:Hypothetical predicted protein [Mytilus galloprovincialis]|uniref:Uncharacterized protein n=1 Tax=Mytilus galloprovincialis TaxID=29158 RepID=A0A8B6GAQ0_MYTGA|nr:Hypothetical predicted protein [Mytilus galloprovincialis]